MLVLPIKTRRLRAGDDLAEILFNHLPICPLDHLTIRPSDILVISSKALATVEGAMIDLRTMRPSAEAKKLAEQMRRSPAFCEAMLGELKRLNGKILGAVPGAALTELHPAGFETGRVLIPSAGLDESNAPEGHAIGWPRDPVASVRRLREELENRFEGVKRNKREKGDKGVPGNAPLSLLSPLPPLSPRLALILSDSTCMPRRLGVTAFALACAGMHPLQKIAGTNDLFGKPLTMTFEAVADQLATAANFVMGNAGQSVPAAIIRDHGLELSDWEGWVPGIDPEADLFRVSSCESREPRNS